MTAAEEAATPADAVALLRSTATIRRRAADLLAQARAHRSAYFSVNEGALDTAAALVAEVTTARYPDLRIPYHSRWRHFEAGGIHRKALLDEALAQSHAGQPPEAARLADGRAHVDLCMVSVLLDAGAGPQWRYDEAASGQPFTRSEGLAVASFHAFMGGLFSSDPAQPLRVDAQGLQSLSVEALARVFQVSPRNPLVGLEGRVQLLHRLGRSLESLPQIFGRGDCGRPGAMLDHLDAPVEVRAIYDTLQTLLAVIWPGRNLIGTAPLGDCWRHPGARGPGLSDGWMPFHKLTQWLTYSLLEPFEWAGRRVSGLDALTGLPEYRNGGLLLDSGVLRLKDEATAARTHDVGDPFIVEWRALTVALLDELAPRVRAQLGRTVHEMPLACVLEGGTWAAGRVLAQQLRGGLPPLKIDSDGTVF